MVYHALVKDTHIIATKWAQPEEQESDCGAERRRQIKFFKPVNLPVAE